MAGISRGKQIHRIMTYAFLGIALVTSSFFLNTTSSAEEGQTRSTTKRLVINIYNQTLDERKEMLHGSHTEHKIDSMPVTAATYKAGDNLEKSTSVSSVYQIVGKYSIEEALMLLEEAFDTSGAILNTQSHSYDYFTNIPYVIDICTTVSYGNRTATGEDVELLSLWQPSEVAGVMWWYQTDKVLPSENMTSKEYAEAHMQSILQGLDLTNHDIRMTSYENDKETVVKGTLYFEGEPTSIDFAFKYSGENELIMAYGQFFNVQQVSDEKIISAYEAATRSNDWRFYGEGYSPYKLNFKKDFSDTNMGLDILPSEVTLTKSSPMWITLYDNRGVGFISQGYRLSDNAGKHNIFVTGLSKENLKLPIRVEVSATISVTS